MYQQINIIMQINPTAYTLYQIYRQYPVISYQERDVQQQDNYHTIHQDLQEIAGTQPFNTTIDQRIYDQSQQPLFYIKPQQIGEYFDRKEFQPIQDHYDHQATGSIPGNKF
ncbi:hypothetical protein [Chitinophaga varians]|uniref:hypothetical protein n=1 Tax=Chitinophaga varians TaxID=2202339 RepID=UPI00165F57B7|nr:hypothetical protein [Chitinophaga varians]MBC9914603.1 hypothetical protein [Chitinophaga varians]